MSARSQRSLDKACAQHTDRRLTTRAIGVGATCVTCTARPGDEPLPALWAFHVLPVHALVFFRHYERATMRAFRRKCSSDRHRVRLLAAGHLNRVGWHFWWHYVLQIVAPYCAPVRQVPCIAQ